MKEQGRRTLLMAFRVLVSVTLLAYLVREVDPAQLLVAWQTIILPFVLLAAGLQLLGVLINALKWWVLIRSSGQHVSYPWTVRTYFIGQFFSNFLPTMIGGDAVRMYQLNLRIRQPSIAVTSVFVERLTGFVALNVIAITALQLSIERFADAPELYRAAIGCIAVASAGLLLALCVAPLTRLLGHLYLPNMFNWHGKLELIAQSLASYYASRGSLALALLLSSAYQLVWIGSNYTLARALRIDVSLAFMALMVPISDIIGLIPIFLNNLGAREGTFVVLLGQLDITKEVALSLAFLIFVVRMAVSVAGGLLYILSGLADIAPVIGQDRPIDTTLTGKP